MEAQAATMMITLVGKSAETTVRVAAKSAEALLKMVAFLASLWKKSSAKGQVKMAKLLESGAPLSAVAMNSENYKKFAELSKQESFIYHAAYREDIDSYLVTLKTEDLQRVKTAMQFYDMDMNTVQQERTEPAAEAADYAANTPSPEQETADPIIAENEMRVTDFDEMVEANAGNSEEMQAVHDRFWPQLKARNNLRVSSVSEQEYTAFKEAVYGKNVAFAPCVQDGVILLAYHAKDAEIVENAVGRELPYKELIPAEEVERRMAEHSKKENIEDVNRDDVAMHKMDELDRREAENLKQEVRENAEEFDFAARKQEVLKENDAVDYDEWVKTAKEGDAIPDNLTVCLEADQEIFDELEKMKKEDLLNEANVVKGLKAEKINDLSKNMPKVKAKDIGIEL